MLTRGEDYAFQSPSLVRKKLRNAELKSGAPRLSTRHTGTRQRVTPDEASVTASSSSRPRTATAA